MKDSFQTHKTTTAGSLLLQEESKKISDKIKELQNHMQREKEKRLDYLNSVNPDSQKLFSVDSSTTHSASPEIENTLLSLLKSCGMDKYFQNFINNQVDDIEKLRNISEGQMESFKIPIGHRLKIIKQLKITQDLAQAALFWKTSSKDQPFIEKNSKKESPSRKDPNFEVFDERESKNTRNVFFKTQEKPGNKEKNFFFGEIGTELSFSLSEKKPCWTCLKVVVEGKGLKRHSKFFCSDNCLDEFQKQEMRSCKCGARFFRKEGIFFEDGWICNICAEKIGE
jgi:hypothetical protein